MLVRVSPLQPTRCNPVALGPKPRESVSNLGPPGRISYLYRLETKLLGSTVRALDLGPTSRKCQCAPQGDPQKPTRCNLVALGLKPRESVSNLGPTGQRGTCVKPVFLAPFRSQNMKVTVQQFLLDVLLVE